MAKFFVQLTAVINGGKFGISIYEIIVFRFSPSVIYEIIVFRFTPISSSNCGSRFDFLYKRRIKREFVAHFCLSSRLSFVGLRPFRLRPSGSFGVPLGMSYACPNFIIYDFFITEIKNT